MIVLLS